MMPDSISRFSRTVENYMRYRPTYHQAIPDFLQVTCQLSHSATIADIGSGTGLLSEVFLRNGYHVLGVEPNPDMRQASQQLLRNYPYFRSIAATAEETTLDSQSVDMIIAGQAFDWFNHEKSRQEFARILKSNGWVALVWNIPRHNTPFLIAYEKFWHKYLASDSQSSDPDTQTFDEKLTRWYSPGIIQIKSFDNSQVVDFEGLKGRVLSSSFAPTPEKTQYAPMLAELATLFQNYQVHGRVTIEYDCRLCYGQLC
jgi:SAM-dependent methyltransferase